MTTQRHISAKQPAATSGQAPAPAPAKKRAAMGMDKRLAIAIAGVLALIDSAGIEKGSKAAEVETARALASEVNQKTIGPIDERIKVLNTEIQTAAKPEALNAIGGAGKLNELTKELTKLHNKRKLFTSKV